MISRTFLLLNFVLLLSILQIKAQQPEASSKEFIEKSIVNRKQLIQNSIVKNIPATCIGPTVMSGRVVDIDVNPNNPIEFYVGYATGGVWYTNNNGTSFLSVLDDHNTQNIGDIAVDWENGTIWVGTGEKNGARSSHMGIGILKSVDKGKTWEHMGLIDSHHISRILINKKNPNEVVVGVIGHLFSPSPERGVYKTKNGGKTWEKTLYINDNIGVIDVAYAPNDFNTMYASSWEKHREPFNFRSHGEGSALYKSNDGGESWKKLDKFPSGEGIGRIGIAVYDKNTVYVVHDSQFKRKNHKKNEDDYKPSLILNDFKSMSSKDFLALNDDELDDFLDYHNFPERYTASSLKELIKNNDAKPLDIFKYIKPKKEEPPVVGAEVYRSDNGGKTWRKTHDDYIDDLYFTYGYYFGEINVNPSDKNDIYIYGVPIFKSKDGGKTFESISRDNVHADHHALWINPHNENHLINGNDGGINITYDDGEHWIKANDAAVGQFYTIQVDNKTPYNVYGGLQDNGTWMGPNNAIESDTWHQTGKYPWDNLMGGDGMQVQVDSRDSDIIYVGYQFGNYFRVNRKTNEQFYLKIEHQLGEEPYRFNWETPILLSPHNQDIIYLGGNKLMRSMNQGKDWTAISDDLTKGYKVGNIPYATITTISESPLQFGLLYTGSDDGEVYVSKNSGSDWNNINKGLPKDLWISRIVASKYKKERVYVSLNGRRSDHFNTYVFVSDNYGETWRDISGDIPDSPVNCIIEDSEKENILYVGTDNGAYMTFDSGKTYHPFVKNLPEVPVHDMKIQEREADLLLATHGRSIYKIDIEEIQALDFSKKASLFQMKDPIYYQSKKDKFEWGSNFSMLRKQSSPSLDIPYIINHSGNYTLTIETEKGKLLKQIPVENKGLGIINMIPYDFTIMKKGKKALEREQDKYSDQLNIQSAGNGIYYLPSGVYHIKLKLDNKTLDEISVEVFYKQ